MPEDLRCDVPHKKISIVEIPDANPEGAHVLSTPELDDDTLPFLGPVTAGGTGMIGCHDITALEGRFQVAGASCLEEGQIWDISDPANPTTKGGPHTHIRNPFITGPPGQLRGLFHTTSFTWDGKILFFTDEWQGGGAHGCDGPQDTRGNVWFYKNVAPGETAPLYGRYMFPRAQPAAEACTLHNGNAIPDPKGRYLGVSAAYEGGTSVFDFSRVTGFPEISVDPTDDVPDTPGVPPVVATEIAWADMQSGDGKGKDDVWSAYWYNDYIYTNGGLGRSGCCRGLDVFRLTDSDGKPFNAPDWLYSNPQTQETWQGVGWGRNK